MYVVCKYTHLSYLTWLSQKNRWRWRKTTYIFEFNVKISIRIIYFASCAKKKKKLNFVIQCYVPSGHCMYRQFNMQQFYVLPTQCIYVFCVDLRTNSYYFPTQQFAACLLTVCVFGIRNEPNFQIFHVLSCYMTLDPSVRTDPRLCDKRAVLKVWSATTFVFL